MPRCVKTRGEHESAEEVRLKAMRRTPRRIPEHLVPLAGTPSDSPPCSVETIKSTRPAVGGALTDSARCAKSRSLAETFAEVPDGRHTAHALRLLAYMLDPTAGQ